MALALVASSAPASAASNAFSLSCALNPGDTIGSWHNAHPGVTNFEFDWTDSSGFPDGNVIGTVNTKKGMTSNTATVPTPSNAATASVTFYNNSTLLASLTQACI